MKRLADMFRSSWAVITNGYIYGTIAIAYLFIVNFPGSYMATVSGGDVDGSWNYALNYLPYSAYLFGSDVVFTYGPLGFLLRPQNIGSNLAAGMAFQVGVHVLFTLGLCYFLYRTRRKLQVILFVVLYLAANILAYGVLFEYNSLLALGMLLCISFDSNRVLKYGSLVLGSLLAGLLIFTKFSVGIVALSMLLTYFIVILYIMRAKAWKILVMVGGIYLLATAVIAFVSMKSAGNIYQWLVYSVDIASGYSEAMGIEGSGISLLLGILALTAYLVLVFIMWRQKSHCLYAALFFVLPAFLAFKHAFCRQDPAHELYIFMLPAIVCVLILNATIKKELLTCLAGFTIIFVLTIPMYQPKYMTIELLSEVARQNNFKAVIGTIVLDNMKIFNDSKTGYFNGQQGMANMGNIVNFTALQSSLDRQGRISLERDRLPGEMVSIIQSGGGNVGVMPWEICYCPANSLEWKPLFALQSYVTSTASLDMRDSANYAGDAAADFLIVEFNSIDNRNIVLDTPASWSKIISDYRVAYHDNTGRLLLKKKEQEGADDRRQLGIVNARANAWIDVPQTNNVLFARVNMKLNIIGRLARTFFRVPPVYIDLIYESGRSVSYRLTANTALNGLLINYLPNNTFELAAILNGISHDRVTKFMIRGNGTDYYDGEIPIAWEESNLVQTTRQSELRDLFSQGICWVGSVDMVNGTPRGPEGTVYLVEDGNKQPVVVEGWMVDQSAQKSAGGVFVNVDSKHDIRALYGFNRNDVADYYEIDDYKLSGFKAFIPASILNKGKHVLTLKIVTDEGNGYYEFHEKINLEIK